MLWVPFMETVNAVSRIRARNQDFNSHPPDDFNMQQVLKTAVSECRHLK